jgi:hypothetical protein
VGDHVNGPGRAPCVLPRSEPASPVSGLGPALVLETPSEEGSQMASLGALVQMQMEPVNPNQFRLERFGKAMTGTDSWEVPGAVLHGEYDLLPPVSSMQT